MNIYKTLWLFITISLFVSCAGSLEMPEYKSALDAYSLGKYQTSITFINQAIENNPDESEYYVLRAKANYKIGNKSSAMEDLNHSLQIVENYSAYHLRGKLYLEKSDLENAGLNLRKAYTLNSQSGDILFDLGYLEFLNGDTQQALNYYSSAAKYDSRNSKVYVNIGNLYSMLGNSKTAIDYYSKALVLDTTDGVAFYNRANEKMIMNDIKGAIEDYNYSLQIDSLNTATLFMLAEANTKIGNISSSLSQYNSIIKIDSLAAKAYYLRGVVNVTNQDFSLACSDFKKAGDLGYFEAYEMIKKYCDKKVLQKEKEIKKKSKTKK